MADTQRYARSWRNTLAMRLCNFILQHVATKWYRDMVGGSITYGLKAAARDTLAEDKQTLDNDEWDEVLFGPRAPV